MSAAVLIVNYRAYHALTACLASLAPYLRPADEVIVVDYQSDRAALSDAADGRPQVSTLPRSDNLGFAAGVNLAAARTRAPFLLLLNPDTLVDGPLIDTLERFMAADAAVGVVGPRVLNADGSVQRSARRFPGVTTLLGGRSSWLSRHFPNNWFSRRNLIDASGPTEVDWVSGSCLMTRRDLFESLGGLDESFFMYWEDADYCRRVHEAGRRCVYAPVASVRHTGGVSAAHDRARMVKTFHQSAFRLYWKHAGFLGRLAAPAVWLVLWVRARTR
jgi:GT2 family glycosyltransferase